MKKINGMLCMDIDDILDSIKGLARSQGYYGRLYEHLIDIRDNDDEKWQNVVEQLEAQHFRTSLDMVLFFEC